MTKRLLIAFAIIAFVQPALAIDPHAFDVGIAEHAFDHLDVFSDQAPTAAASGSTIIYGTGLGASYTGLPAPDEMQAIQSKTTDYLKTARADGIQVPIGYICATSIVDLPKFDRNWTPEFRAQFKTPPAKWLQVDRHGKPLVSWYGKPYEPACMSNPDWRAYEKDIVRLQLQAGFDGIFFDNPTVHPKGCYCEHCMHAFAKYLNLKDEPSLEDMRKMADARHEDFLKFRATIASSFLKEIRDYARTIKPGAIITCNNSLNAPHVFYNQAVNYGYNIYEMSKVEDLVVVEDEHTQPRTNSTGVVVEYAPVYECLTSISHHKPVVAINLADGDYHTAPELVRLAMAEAVAHNCSYLSWPCWPENQRKRMAQTIRPEADFLHENTALLNNARPRADVTLFLPFRLWTKNPHCVALNNATALSANNIQYQVVCEDDLIQTLRENPNTILLAEHDAFLTPEEKQAVKHFESAGGKVVWTALDKNWIGACQRLAKSPGVKLKAPRAVRVVVRDTQNATVVHVLNLEVQKVNSFEDKVKPAENVSLDISVPMSSVKSVRALSADADATKGTIPFKQNGNVVHVELPRIVLSTMLVVE
jgi:hypothetical protein